MFSVNAGLKVEMFCRGSSRSACKCYGLACFYLISWFYEVFGIVAIDRFQSVIMPDHNDISIGGVTFGHTDNTIESSNYRVVSECLNVNACMISSSSSIRRNDFCIG